MTIISGFLIRQSLLQHRGSLLWPERHHSLLCPRWDPRTSEVRQNQAEKQNWQVCQTSAVLRCQVDAHLWNILRVRFETYFMIFKQCSIYLLSFACSFSHVWQRFFLLLKIRMCRSVDRSSPRRGRANPDVPRRLRHFRRLRRRHRQTPTRFIQHRRKNRRRRPRP